jgi:serine/threonine protein kinase
LQRTSPVVNADKLKSFARDILAGLAHIHHHNIIHADIKVENILAFSP